MLATCARQAWRVMCRAATWAISCAMALAISASVSAAVNRPVFTKMTPPGSAKALRTGSSITWKVNGTLASELRARFWPTRREGLENGVVNHLESERHLGVGVACQVLAHPVHVLGDDRVVHQLRLALDLSSQLLAHGDLFFDGIAIEAAHVPVADLARIVFFGFIIIG